MPKITPYQNIRHAAIHFARAVLNPKQKLLGNWPKGVEAIDGRDLTAQVKTIQQMGYIAVLKEKDGVLQIVAQEQPPAPNWQFAP